MKNSCVWYSHFVTAKLGMAKFQEYVKKFEYGNQDVSGDKGKDNGLTSSWISSSLKISPLEQVAFIEKILQSKSPVKKEALQFTRNLLYLEVLPEGWKLYGKTGVGDLLHKDGSHDRTRQRGWFVGWIERGDRKVVFANYLEEETPKNVNNLARYAASKHAKEAAKEKLLQFIQLYR